jgi:hypothetical protein
MKKRADVLIISSFFLFGFLNRSAAQNPGWNGLANGKYAVGFTAIRENNTNGYPMLTGIWYPASVTGGSPMTWKDLIQLGGAAVNQNDSVLLETFRTTIAIKGIFGVDIPIALYYKAVTTATNTYQDADMLPESFPLIIARGRPISYAPSFEFLASHGFIIAVVDCSFPSDTLSDDNPRFFVKYTNLMEELLHKMIRYPHVLQSDISVFGHGGGIQAALFLAMRNPLIKKAINLDGGFFGSRSKSQISIDYHPGKLSIPLLHVITVSQQKEDDEKQFTALANPITRVAIKSAEFKHHDITAFGRFLNTVKMRGGDDAQINQVFQEINSLMLDFLTGKAVSKTDNRFFVIDNYNGR